MSVKGISLGNFSAPDVTQGAQNRFQQIQGSFQQLGQDLTAGNLGQAQQDFATLMQNIPGQQQTSAANSNSPIARSFTTLGNDLHAGNLTAAQQDFAALQQDVQQQHDAGGAHHHQFGDSHSALSGIFTQNSPLAQAFTQVGQTLQSRYLTPAHQAYTTLQEELQKYLPTSASSSTTAPSSGTINVTV